MKGVERAAVSGWKKIFFSDTFPTRVTHFSVLLAAGKYSVKRPKYGRNAKGY